LKFNIKISTNYLILIIKKNGNSKIKSKIKNKKKKFKENIIKIMKVVLQLHLFEDKVNMTEIDETILQLYTILKQTKENKYKVIIKRIDKNEKFIEMMGVKDILKAANFEKKENYYELKKNKFNENEIDVILGVVYDQLSDEHKELFKEEEKLENKKVTKDVPKDVKQEKEENKMEVIEVKQEKEENKMEVIKEKKVEEIIIEKIEDNKMEVKYENNEPKETKEIKEIKEMDRLTYTKLEKTFLEKSKQLYKTIFYETVKYKNKKGRKRHINNNENGNSNI
jgi:hypothetical protein